MYDARKDYLNQIFKILLNLLVALVIYYVIGGIARGQWGVVVPPDKNFGSFPP